MGNAIKKYVIKVRSEMAVACPGGSPYRPIV